MRYAYALTNILVAQMGNDPMHSSFLRGYSSSFWCPSTLSVLLLPRRQRNAYAVALYYRSWSASSRTHASSAPSLLLELSVDRLARAERTCKLQDCTVSFPDFSQYTSLHSAAGNAIDLPYMISCLCPLSSTALLPNNRPSRFSGSLSLRRVRRIW